MGCRLNRHKRHIRQELIGCRHIRHKRPNRLELMGCRHKRHIRQELIGESLIGWELNGL